MSLFSLKVIALISMLSDHIGSFISGSPIVMRWIGRIAAPIFLFAAVEGWQNTRNRRMYLLRLYLASVLMGSVQYILDVDYNFFRQIFCVCCWFGLADLVRENRKSFWKYLLVYLAWQVSSWIIGVMVAGRFGDQAAMYLVMPVLGSAVFVEGGLIYTFLGLLMYITRHDKKKLIFSYLAFSLIFFILNTTSLIRRGMIVITRLEIFLFGSSGSLSNVAELLLDLLGFHPMQVGGPAFTVNYQWMLILALPFIVAYDGTRGKKVKYFFYVFYPLHIILLYYIGNIL